jgi:CheY-like chemotaxis protein
MHHQSILVVENNERESNLIKLVLESEGYGVDIASSGWAALEKIKSKDYYLAFVDFGLSDMKGDELAEAFKTKVPGLQLILLTGFLSAIDLKRAEMFDYVYEKPVNPQKILETIKHVRSDRKIRNAQLG